MRRHQDIPIIPYTKQGGYFTYVPARNTSHSFFPARLNFTSTYRPVQPPAMERDLDLLIIPVFRLICAAVPDGDRAGPVLALWDLAFKCSVCKRVVLDGYGKVLLPCGLRDALGYRQLFQHAVPFQPQVVVQVGCMVLMDDKTVPAHIR